MSCRLVRFLSVLILCGCAAAQTSDNKPTASYKIRAIHVAGLKRLSEDQVIFASGLKTGQMAGEAEFQQAAQKLGGTGLFTNLTYSYQYSGAGCDLSFQVEENDKLLPIIFENFVWFSDDDLLAELRARVPLFEGQVPAEGDLTEQVADALISILHERKIPGEVQYLAFTTDQGPVQAYAYKVTLHPIVIRNAEFPGATADDLAALQAKEQELSGEDYLRTTLRVQAELDFLPTYHARGFLKAQFADAQPKVVEDQARTVVDVSFPVTRGAQYKLKAIELNGHNALSAEQLRGLIQLKVGDAANAVQLDENIDQMRKLYATKGYLFAEIQPVAATDDQAATVTYTLNVKEGELYHMGDLNIDGLPEANATRMAAQWQMKKGDPFDDGYLQRFFSVLYQDFDLRGSYAVSSKRAINQQDKTVSVSLHFVRKG